MRRWPSTCKTTTPSIRRGAALAVGQKESKSLVPNLIGVLRDPEISVVEPRHASLKALTEQDFGPSAKASREERDQAVLKWIEWWNKQAQESCERMRETPAACTARASHTGAAGLVG